MYTRESVSTDRYTGDESGSGRDDAQNTTAMSSDWSVRPSDSSTAADTTQFNSLSRLNPAAAPFSFGGGGGGGGGSPAVGVSAGRDELMGPARPHHPHQGSTNSSGVGMPLPQHHHHHHPSSMMSGSSLDGNGPSNGVATGMGSRAVMGGNSNNGGGGVMGHDSGSPNSFGLMPGMVGGGGGGGPYGMPAGHRASPLSSRGQGMMDFGGMHGGSPLGGGGMGPRMGGGGGLSSPSSFLPPPGEDTDQQELFRLQQTNYRVKMLPPPLTYEVHRKIWSRNEYGNDDEDEYHNGAGGGAGGGNGMGLMGEPEVESLHSLANEDPVDKEQRLEAYKQIMLRWYSHIHVLEEKSEVAKRLVRVRRACPSMEEIIANLTNPPPPGAATSNTGSDGGGDDDAYPAAPPPPAAAAAARRNPSDPLDTEEVLATWSARCWDWWQETVKRKPRRARKQGEVPMSGGGGLPTSASAPMVAAMGDGYLPHSLSARAMDAEVTSPHLPGSTHGSAHAAAGPYTHHGSYTSHPNGSFLEGGGAPGAAAAVVAGAGPGMPMAPSYTSFTDLSEEGGAEGPARSLGQSPQQHQQSYPGRPSPQLPPGHHQQQQQQRMTPPQPQQQQAAGSQDGTPSAAVFTTNGIRAAAPRSGNPDDFLENDHLTLAFTTELLKSLEE